MGHRKIIVRALLESAPQIKDTVPLDALLLYGMGARMSSELGGITIPTEEVIAQPLPLARVSGRGADWWHACSTVYATGLEERRHIHRRAPVHLYTAFTDAKSVNIASGPDKSVRKAAFTRTEMLVLYWVAVGDPAEVATLLSFVRAIGSGRAQGMGLVRDWEVRTYDQGPDLEEYGRNPRLRELPTYVCRPDGAFMRRQVRLRPPYYSPLDRVECWRLMPDEEAAAPPRPRQLAEKLPPPPAPALDPHRDFFAEADLLTTAPPPARRPWRSP